MELWQNIRNISQADLCPTNVPKSLRKKMQIFEDATNFPQPETLFGLRVTNRD